MPQTKDHVDHPLISIITVNYNGQRFIKGLLDSLYKQDYPNIEVLFVDNDSKDDSIEFVKQHFPKTKIVPNKENYGFAGGNNSAIPHCNGEYILLINNDTIVDPKWVSKIYESLVKNKADIVGPKILFYKPFVTLKITVNTFNPSKTGLSGDTRDLGCMISSDIQIKDANYDKTLFTKNCYGDESAGDLDFHWVSNKAEIKVPVDLDLDKFILKGKISVSDLQKQETIKISIGDTEIWSKQIGSTFEDFSAEISPEIIKKHARYVINNVGSTIDEKRGVGKDLGMLEDDNGQYDTPKEAESLCGCSWLVKKSIIDELGLFDASFFMYYEDSDFCWRLRKKGKKLFYCPESIVYHIHTGSSKEWSPFFRFHVERNRLMMIFKNATWGNVIHNFAAFFFKTLISSRHLLKKSTPPKIKEIIKINLKVCFNLFLHLPILPIKRYTKTKLKVK